MGPSRVRLYQISLPIVQLPSARLLRTPYRRQWLWVGRQEVLEYHLLLVGLLDQLHQLAVAGEQEDRLRASIGSFYPGPALPHPPSRISCDGSCSPNFPFLGRGLPESERLLRRLTSRFRHLGQFPTWGMPFLALRSDAMVIPRYSAGD